MSSLSSMLAPERIVFLDAQPKFKIINQMVDVLATSPSITNADALRKAVTEREKELSTGIGQGLAIPHARIADASDFAIAVGICKDGVDFDSFDGQSIHFIVMIAANIKQAREYIKVLAKVVKVFKEQENCDAILRATTAEEVCEFFKKF